VRQIEAALLKLPRGGHAELLTRHAFYDKLTDAHSGPGPPGTSVQRPWRFP
jgi:hypothetical protein